jgi:sensor histidine kinase YesM
MAKIKIAWSFPRLRMLIQTAFWGGYLMLGLLTLSGIIGILPAFLRTLMHGGVLAAVAHLHLLLISRHLEGRRYRVYAALTFGLILSTVLLRLGVDHVLRGLFGEIPAAPFGSRRHWGILIGSTLVVLIMTSPLRLLEHWFAAREQQQALQRRQLEAELNFLKAQINPHFLFNALNNLYSLAFTGSDRVPDLIMRLSEMMRYVIYDCRAEQVPLEQELQYLRHYIAFQQIKNVAPMRISLREEGRTEGVSIPPMLIAPLVENAFKHGNLGSSDAAWLDIVLGVEGSLLCCEVRNTKGAGGPKDGQGGIGLDNICKRLELLYPGAFRLDAADSAAEFHVSLLIPLSHEKRSAPLLPHR